jgi:hypothetical protein
VEEWEGLVPPLQVWGGVSAVVSMVESVQERATEWDEGGVEVEAAGEGTEDGRGSLGRRGEKE